MLKEWLTLNPFTSSQYLKKVVYGYTIIVDWVEGLPWFTWTFVNLYTNLSLIFCVGYWKDEIGMFITAQCHDNQFISSESTAHSCPLFSFAPAKNLD